MMGIEAYVWSNAMTGLLLVGMLWAARVVRGNRLWREAASELWRRRWLAILVVGLYLGIGVADSIAWVGGIPEDAVGVLPNSPLSIIDRLFLDTREASYSAPLASFICIGTIRVPPATPCTSSGRTVASRISC